MLWIKMIITSQNRWHVRMSIHGISRVWTKISLRLSGYIRNYVLRVLHNVVFPIIGLAGTEMVLEKPDTKTMWHAWTEKNLPELISKQSGKNWVFNYVRRSVESKNSRAMFLLPFIIVLKITAPPKESPSPESSLMYTLF